MYKATKMSGISKAVYEIAKPIAEKLNFELWDVQFLKEGSNWYLRVFIDKPGGITLEDCEKMSRALDAPLDAEDPVDRSYCLEVSSPGIERELSSDTHLEKFINSKVSVKLIRPTETKQKTVCGKLDSFDKEYIFLITSENKKIPVFKKNISHINLNITEEI